MSENRVSLGISLEKVVPAPPRRRAVTVSAIAVVHGRDVPVPEGLEHALFEVLDLLHRCVSRLAVRSDVVKALSGEDDSPSWEEHVRDALDELSREGGDVDAAIRSLEKILGEEGG